MLLDLLVAGAMAMAAKITDFFRKIVALPPLPVYSLFCQLVLLFIIRFAARTVMAIKWENMKIKIIKFLVVRAMFSAVSMNVSSMLNERFMSLHKSGRFLVAAKMITDFLKMITLAIYQNRFSVS